MMICPACDHALTAMRVGGLTVDVCQGGCGGIWFDAFELRQVDEPHEAAGEPLLGVARDATIHVDPARKRDCPRCFRVKLKRRFFSPRRQVEVDECPGCGGIWLDAGELGKIREEKAQAGAEEKIRQPYLTPEVIRQIYRAKLAIQGGA